MMNFACLNDEDLADKLVSVLAEERFSSDNSLVALLSVCAERIRNKTQVSIPSEFDAQIACTVFERITESARVSYSEVEKLHKKMVEIDNMRPHVEIRIDAPKIMPKRVRGGIR